MVIDSYDFGRMVVDGIEYTSDLIVYPQVVAADWWRHDGHSLCRADLTPVLDFGPEVLVVGTGAYGVMQVPDELRKALTHEGIELVTVRTSEAITVFNERLQAGAKVVGAFHLTC